MPQGNALQTSPKTGLDRRTETQPLRPALCAISIHGVVPRGRISTRSHAGDSGQPSPPGAPPTAISPRSHAQPGVARNNPKELTRSIDHRHPLDMHALHQEHGVFQHRRWSARMHMVEHD